MRLRSGAVDIGNPARDPLHGMVFIPRKVALMRSAVEDWQGLPGGFA
jgi:hypothetical protein